MWGDAAVHPCSPVDMVNFTRSTVSVVNAATHAVIAAIPVGMTSPCNPGADSSRA